MRLSTCTHVGLYMWSDQPIVDGVIDKGAWKNYRV